MRWGNRKIRFLRGIQEHTNMQGELPKQAGLEQFANLRWDLEK